MPYAQKTASETNKTKEVHVIVTNTVGGWLPMTIWWNDVDAVYEGDGFWDERIRYPYSFENLDKANKAADEWAQDEEIAVVLRTP